MMPVVKWFAELARNHRKAVILLHHLRERGLTDVSDVVTLNRVRGATAIVQPARRVGYRRTRSRAHPEHKRLSVTRAISDASRSRLECVSTTAA